MVVQIRGPPDFLDGRFPALDGDLQHHRSDAVARADEDLAFVEDGREDVFVPRRDVFELPQEFAGVRIHADGVLRSHGQDHPQPLMHDQSG